MSSFCESGICIHSAEQSFCSNPQLQSIRFLIISNIQCALSHLHNLAYTLFTRTHTTVNFRSHFKITQKLLCETFSEPINPHPLRHHCKTRRAVLQLFAYTSSQAEFLGRKANTFPIIVFQIPKPMTVNSINDY